MFIPTFISTIMYIYIVDFTLFDVISFIIPKINYLLIDLSSLFVCFTIEAFDIDKY